MSLWYIDTCRLIHEDCIYWMTEHLICVDPLVYIVFELRDVASYFHSVVCYVC